MTSLVVPPAGRESKGTPNRRGDAVRSRPPTHQAAKDLEALQASSDQIEVSCMVKYYRIQPEVLIQHRPGNSRQIVWVLNVFKHT